MIMTGIARLGRDAEVTMTNSGTAVANLNLAFTVGWGDRKETTWIRAALWGKQAESLQQYLLKGTVINVALEDLTLREWSSNGKSGASLEAKVMKLEFVPKQSDSAPTESGNNQQKTRSEEAKQQRQQDAEEFEISDDGIPF